MSSLQQLLNKKPYDFNEIWGLIEKGADANTKNAKGDSLLHIVVNEMAGKAQPDLECLLSTLALEYKVNLNIKNAKGLTPLQTLLANPASFKSDVLRLINLGANPNVRYEGQPVIFYFYNNINQLQELVQLKANINGQDSSGRTLLANLLDKLPLDYVTLAALIKLGADPRTKNSQGQTLGHLLVKEIAGNSQSPLIVLLQDFIAKSPSNIHIKNRSGQTMLQMLVQQNKIENVPDILRLVALGADPNTKNREGISLLHLMLSPDLNKASSLKYSQELIDHGADIHAKNAKGQSFYDLIIADPERWSLLKTIGVMPKETMDPPIDRAKLKITKSSKNTPLLQLLINHKASELTEDFYEKKKHAKEQMFNFIKTFNLEDKTTWLIKALDPDQALGHLMFMKRGFRSTAYSRGILLAIAAELRVTLFRSPGLLEKPELFLNLLAIPQLSELCILPQVKQEYIKELVAHIETLPQNEITLYFNRLQKIFPDCKQYMTKKPSITTEPSAQLSIRFEPAVTAYTTAPPEVETNTISPIPASSFTPAVAAYTIAPPEVKTNTISPIPAPSFTPAVAAYTISSIPAPSPEVVQTVASDIPDYDPPPPYTHPYTRLWKQDYRERQTARPSLAELLASAATEPKPIRSVDELLDDPIPPQPIDPLIPVSDKIPTRPTAEDDFAAQFPKVPTGDMPGFWNKGAKSEKQSSSTQSSNSMIIPS